MPLIGLINITTCSHTDHLIVLQILQWICSVNTKVHLKHQHLEVNLWHFGRLGFDVFTTIQDQDL